MSLNQDKVYYSFSQKIVMVVSLCLLLNSFLIQVYDWQWLNFTTDQFSLICIFIGSLLLWLFVALDWPSLLTLLALSFISDYNLAKIASLSFGNSTFVFLFLTFIVTAALNQTSCLSRLTAWALNQAWVQAQPRRFIRVMLLVFLALAMIFSPSVLFMFVFPIYEELCQQFNWQKGESSAAYLLFAVYATLAIGTAMTPINHVFAITAMGIYQSASGQSISNFQYMQIGIPTGLLIFAVLLLSLRYVFPLKIDRMHISDIKSIQVTGKLTLREKIVGALFLLMVALWILPELMTGLWPAFSLMIKNTGIVFPPLLVAILMAMIVIDGQPLLNIPQAMSKGVHWPSLLLVAATLCLGSMIASPELGLVDLINQTFSTWFQGLPVLLVILLFVVWAGLQTNLSSNLVTVSMVTTVAVSLIGSSAMQDIHLNVLACLIGLMASLAWMTPPAMPYVAISIGSGWIHSRQSLTLGLWLLFWSILIVSFIAYPLGMVLI
ncbi:SLC13 family permease [Ignavigranum ruoffiae]|uniref:SLC13 family permease n=1 Tax=Ignavigranum ruoffiae TaxID=89093 RepID=UPI002352D621|nr:SLC13 family permease [Ignavigranum ruoffiae]